MSFSFICIEMSGTKSQVEPCSTRIVYPCIQSSACKSANVLQHFIASVWRQSSTFVPPKLQSPLWLQKFTNWFSSTICQLTASQFRNAAETVVFSKMVFFNYHFFVVPLRLSFASRRFCPVEYHFPNCYPFYWFICSYHYRVLTARFYAQILELQFYS